MLGFATAIVVLGLLAGVSGASPSVSGPGGSVSAVPALNTSQSFNFSASHPDWGTGNLCTPVTTGSTVTCDYSGHSGHGFGTSEGQCGCKTQTALTYNFSGTGYAFYVNIKSLDSQAVYLNFAGHNDTIFINVTGCRGGTLNVTALMQTTLTLNVTSSSVKAWIYLYTDADHYVGEISGGHSTIWTYFVSARVKYNECPAANNTKTDSYILDITGREIYQGLIFVNGVGYSTPTNVVGTGDSNDVAFENTTTFGCMWSNAPTSTCHHGLNPVFEGTAFRDEE
jgi:hypothetical protein